MPARARVVALLIGLAAAGLLAAADAGSKTWAETELRRRGPEAALGGALLLRYQTNRGVAFGLLQDRGHPWQRPALVAYSAAMGAALLALLVWQALRGESGGSVGEHRLRLTGLVALLGGTLGNLRDRIRLGAVVDFLDVQLPFGLGWPTFNLADVFLAVGLVCCAVGIVKWQRRARAAETR